MKKKMNLKCIAGLLCMLVFLSGNVFASEIPESEQEVVPVEAETNDGYVDWEDELLSNGYAWIDDLKVGETKNIQIDGVVGPFTYTSQNEAIATVDASGKVTAIAAGATKIDITKVDDNSVSMVCDVTVYGDAALTEGTTAVDAYHKYTFTPAVSGSYLLQGQTDKATITISTGQGFYGSYDLGTIGDGVFNCYAVLEAGKTYYVRIDTKFDSRTEEIGVFDLTISQRAIPVDELHEGDNIIDPTHVQHFVADEDCVYDISPVESQEYDYATDDGKYVSVSSLNTENRCIGNGTNRWDLKAGEDVYLGFDLYPDKYLVRVTKIHEYALQLGDNEVKNGNMYTFTPTETGKYRITTSNSGKPYVEGCDDRESAYGGCFDELFGDYYAEDGVNIDAVWELTAGTTYYIYVNDSVKGAFTLTIEQKEDDIVADTPVTTIEPNDTEVVKDTAITPKAPKTGDPGMPLALPGIAIAAGFGMIVCRRKKY